MKPQHEHEQDLKWWEDLENPEPNLTLPQIDLNQVGQAQREETFRALRKKYHNFSDNRPDPQTTR